MDNAVFAQELAKKLAAACELARVSKNALAEQTGIPYSTLHRKMQRPTLFTITELNAVAMVLGVETTQLLPSQGEVAA